MMTVGVLKYNRNVVDAFPRTDSIVGRFLVIFLFGENVEINQVTSLKRE